MDTQETLIKYAVGFNSRFNRKQKNKFVNEIGKDFQALGYEVRGAVSKKKGSVSMNLMVGDANKADIIIVANYDTPQHNYGNPLKYFPFKGPASFSSSFLPIYTPLILTSVLLILIIMNLVPKIDFTNNLIPSIFITLSIIVIAIISMIFTKGTSNKVNFNRNTSGVIAMLMVAEKLKGKNGNVAFVLSDNGCSNHSGDYMLREALPKTIDNKLVIVLDCVGVGDMFAIGYREDNKKEALELASNFSTECKSKFCMKEDLRYTSFSFYLNGLLLTRGYKKDDTITIENSGTNNDSDCDLEALEECAKALSAFILKYRRFYVSSNA